MPPYLHGFHALLRAAGEWENRCSEMQRCIIVRCLRPDRIVFATTAFIVNNLGAKFTEPPVLDLNSVRPAPASRSRSPAPGARL